MCPNNYKIFTQFLQIFLEDFSKNRSRYPYFALELLQDYPVDILVLIYCFRICESCPRLQNYPLYFCKSCFYYPHKFELLKMDVKNEQRSMLKFSC